MIIAEDSRAAIALLPFSRDQDRGINLEMPDRINGDIFRSPITAHPAVAAKEDAAYFLWRSGQGQLLDFCQYGA